MNPVAGRSPSAAAPGIVARGFLTVLVLVVGLALACAKLPQEAVRYHCPMHPTYVADQPGDCPICGMRLVPIEKTPTVPVPVPVPPTSDLRPRTSDVVSPSQVWVCPMASCGTVTDQPGRCPKCGMKLVPKDAKDVDRLPEPSGSPEAPASGAAPQASGALAPDHAPVVVDATALRLAGVQTAVARRDTLRRTVRAVGQVTADETRVRRVHTRISGWVDKLFVDFTGQAVRKGKPILAIYSQELMAGQEEYLRAREAAKKLGASSLPEVRKGGEELVAAARRRLELLDVPQAFLDELDRTGQSRRSVVLMAPSSGVVTAKQVFEGQQVDPGTELFTVTDLSHVWIEADLHENEAGRVHVGDEATLSLTSAPGARRTGRVKFVWPVLTPETRTLKVRFEFDNPDGALKPGMFADVDLVLDVANGVVVPDEAVMDTGTRQVVFVDTGDGRFEPRDVKVGLRADGRVQVVEGLRDGERVAAAANFLLDSESRLRAALAPVGVGH